MSLFTTYSTNFEDQHQYSVQAQGAIVAHRHGITLNNELGDTFGIVHAKDLKGVHLRNGQNVKFDHFGNAIVSYFTPYQYNIVQLNSDTLPIEIEVDAVSEQVVPKKNASMLVEFNVINTNKALIELRHENTNIPMGAQVLDDRNLMIALVGQGQQVYFINILAGSYRVVWGGSSCHFNISDDMLKIKQKPFLNLTLVCQ